MRLHRCCGPVVWPSLWCCSSRQLPNFMLAAPVLTTAGYGAYLWGRRCTRTASGFFSAPVAPFLAHYLLLAVLATVVMNVQVCVFAGAFPVTQVCWFAVMVYRGCHLSDCDAVPQLLSRVVLDPCACLEAQPATLVQTRSPHLVSRFLSHRNGVV